VRTESYRVNNLYGWTTITQRAGICSFGQLRVGCVLYSVYEYDGSEVLHPVYTHKRHCIIYIR